MRVWWAFDLVTDLPRWRANDGSHEQPGQMSECQRWLPLGGQAPDSTGRLCLTRLPIVDQKNSTKSQVYSNKGDIWGWDKFKSACSLCDVSFSVTVTPRLYHCIRNIETWSVLWWCACINPIFRIKISWLFMKPNSSI